MKHIAIRVRSGLSKHERMLSPDFTDALREAVTILEADGDEVALTYTNYRGETAERKIRPMFVYFGATEWHPEPQWLLRAFDFDKAAERDFALSDFGKRESTVVTDEMVNIFKKAFHSSRELNHEADIRRGLEAVLGVKAE